MTAPTKTPPSLADLMVRFVSRPVTAAAIEAESGALGEVEPHEVAVGFRSDPRLAWTEGLTAFSAFGLKDAVNTTAPADWAGMVVRHEAVAAQPFALAGYPQRVRDLTALLQAKDLTPLRPNGESRPASTGLRAWADKQAEKNGAAAALLAAAILRAAQDLEHAESILNALQTQLPEALQSAFANEKAALLWQKGNADEAAALWESLPETSAVLFNRGMATLPGRIAPARESLKKAVALIPESDGWHHLANLYLALAEMKN